MAPSPLRKYRILATNNNVCLQERKCKTLPRYEIIMKKSIVFIYHILTLTASDMNVFRRSIQQQTEIGLNFIAAVVTNNLMWIIFCHISNQKICYWSASLRCLFSCYCAENAIHSCLSNKLPLAISAHENSWRTRQSENPVLRSKSSGKVEFNRDCRGHTVVMRSVGPGSACWSEEVSVFKKQTTSSSAFLFCILAVFNFIRSFYLTLAVDTATHLMISLAPSCLMKV